MHVFLSKFKRLKIFLYDRKFLFAFLFFLAGSVCFLVDFSTVAYAAGAEDVLKPSVASTTKAYISTFTLNDGTYEGMGAFEKMIHNFANGFASVGRAISVTLVAIGGLMYVFGLQQGNQLVWQSMLGIGLAINVASLFQAMFGDGSAYTAATATARSSFTIDLSSTSMGFDIPSEFMKFYVKNIIEVGAVAIMPYCMKLTILLAFIDTAVKLAFNVVSGDKAKFLLTTFLKIGFFMFLVEHWVVPGKDDAWSGISLTGALVQGFEAMGYIMGGLDANSIMLAEGSSAAAAEGSSAPAVPSAIGTGVSGIMHNSFVIIGGMWTIITNASLFSMQAFAVLFGLIALVIMIYLLFNVGLEIFVAYLEFHSMSLLTMILLPLGMIEQTKDFFQKAIGAMFTLSIKMCAIAFVMSVTGKLLQTYTEEFLKATGLGTYDERSAFLEKVMRGSFDSAANDIFTTANFFLTGILVCFICYLMVKKLPALVQGLLSGNPQLGGGDMREQFKAAVAGAGDFFRTLGAAQGYIGAAMNQAGEVDGSIKHPLDTLNRGAGKLMSTMGNLGAAAGRAVYHNNPFAEGRREALGKMLNPNTGLLTGDAGIVNGTGMNSGDLYESSAPAKLDAAGKPIMKEKTDKKGNTVMHQKVDKNGNPVVDEEGNPVMVPTMVPDARHATGVTGHAANAASWTAAQARKAGKKLDLVEGDPVTNAPFAEAGADSKGDSTGFKSAGDTSKMSGQASSGAGGNKLGASSSSGAGGNNPGDSGSGSAESVPVENAADSSPADMSSRGGAATTGASSAPAGNNGQMSRNFIQGQGSHSISETDIAYTDGGTSTRVTESGQQGASSAPSYGGGGSSADRSFQSTVNGNGGLSQHNVTVVNGPDSSATNISYEGSNGGSAPGVSAIGGSGSNQSFQSTVNGSGSTFTNNVSVRDGDSTIIDNVSHSAGSVNNESSESFASGNNNGPGLGHRGKNGDRNVITESVRDDDNYVEVHTVHNGGNTRVQESPERNSGLNGVNNGPLGRHNRRTDINSFNDNNKE